MRWPLPPSASERSPNLTTTPISPNSESILARLVVRDRIPESPRRRQGDRQEAGCLHRGRGHLRPIHARGGAMVRVGLRHPSPQGRRAVPVDRASLLRSTGDADGRLHVSAPLPRRVQEQISPEAEPWLQAIRRPRGRTQLKAGRLRSSTAHKENDGDGTRSRNQHRSDSRSARGCGVRGASGPRFPHTSSSDVSSWGSIAG
jgi:hypothetical protein